MQINPERARIKSASFSGTTDDAGNVLISQTAVNVFLAKLDQGAISFPFIYLSGATYLHVRAAGSGSILANYDVTGTYYYIED